MQKAICALPCYPTRLRLGDFFCQGYAKNLLSHLFHCYFCSLGIALLQVLGSFFGTFLEGFWVGPEVVGLSPVADWNTCLELPLQGLSVWDTSADVPFASPLQPIKSELPVNMENLQLNDSIGQPYGYVLYETVIFGGGHLHTRDHVRDRAQVGARSVWQKMLWSGQRGRDGGETWNFRSFHFSAKPQTLITSN